MLFYFSFAKYTYALMRKLKKFIGGFYYEKEQFDLCMGT